ncbi:MAG: AMP-binding enzyme [Gammaproteobacteria bacterium]
MKTLRQTLATATATLLAALVAATTFAVSPAQAQGALKIGEINSYKAQPAFLEPYRKGMELAVDEINAAGGVNGRKIELVSRDDNANPGDAVRVAGELLLREQVEVLAGGFLSNVGLALTDFAKQKKVFYLAGEPLDETTSAWIQDALGVPVIDNYWQTETGWPILSACPGVEKLPKKFGSPSFPAYGFNVKLLDEQTGEEVATGEKGVVAIVPPLPPGCLQTIWRDDARFLDTYFSTIPGRQAYSTFDWGTRDADGYWYILGRTDDVINVAGHRLGTREIEEALLSHPAVAECAVVGVADPLKGQVALAFVVPRDPGAASAQPDRLALEGALMSTVDQRLGAVARPARVHFVSLLPKTRSGKVLRRSLQALGEGRDPGDLPTIEDASALDQVRAALAAR